MNVAKEGPLENRRSGDLVQSDFMQGCSLHKRPVGRSDNRVLQEDMTEKNASVTVLSL